MEKGVDVTKRWIEMGWVPPSQDPIYLEKWKEQKRLSEQTNLKEANETDQSPQSPTDVC